MSERVATSPRLDQARARQYRSTAPVELVQSPRISLPLAQPRIRPSATLAAGLVGRENVIAGTDCGLGGRVHADLAWAKLRTLVEGARLASGSLWP